MLWAYGCVAGIALCIGLASTPRPRSIVLITLAALAWPITMLAVTLHAYCLDDRKKRDGTLLGTAASTLTDPDPTRRLCKG